MPRGKYKKKGSKGRGRATVAKRVAIPSMRVSSFSSFLPSTKVVKLTYKQNLAMVSTSGIIYKNQFAIGNLYDPDYTGAGHQPHGFDQLAALYKQYVVMGAKMTVNFRNAATNNIPHQVGSWLDRDLSIDETTMTALAEAAPNKRNFSVLDANSNSKAHTVCFYSLRKYNNLDSETTDHRYIGEFTGGPTLWDTINVAIQPIDSASTTAQYVYAEVTIDYIVRVLQPLQFTQS